MALQLNEKLERILSFLVGVRNPRVFAVMTTRGFTEEDLHEGWDLFNVAAGYKLTYTSEAGNILSPDMARELLAKLDDWENTWFPVVDATLERRFPEIHSKVFLNLSQTDGAEVILSVGTLLTRLDELSGTEQGDQALALLKKRGLTSEVRNEAFGMVEKIKTADTTDLPELDPDRKAEQEEAIGSSWGWYKEWSQIARTLIKRGDVLIRLGLREVSRKSSTAEPPQSA